MLAVESTQDVMERRLLSWAAWRCGAGCADGFPTKSVLHPSWSPPSGGQLPAMRVVFRGDAAERELDGKVQQLSVRLRDALYVVYIKRMSPADQARALQCQPGTVRARIAEAKRQLAAMR